VSQAISLLLDEDVTEDITKTYNTNYQVFPYYNFMKQFWIQEIGRCNGLYKYYHRNNDDRYDEVDQDLINIFKEIKVEWKRKAEGVCEKEATIDINALVMLKTDFKEEIMELFRNDYDREKKYVKQNPINYYCLLTLEVTKWRKMKKVIIFLNVKGYFKIIRDLTMNMKMKKKKYGMLLWLKRT
jgi:hypothetical protein